MGIGYKNMHKHDVISAAGRPACINNMPVYERQEKSLAPHVNEAMRWSNLIHEKCF